MNCAREGCGHSEKVHYESAVAGELPLNCMACKCPAFSVMPAEMPKGRDDEETLPFDRSEDPEGTR